MDGCRAPEAIQDFSVAIVPCPNRLKKAFRLVPIGGAAKALLQSDTGLMSIRFRAFLVVKDR